MASTNYKRDLKEKTNIYLNIKLEEIIYKISQWLQCKHVSNTKGRITCSHFDNTHTCLSSWGFHFLVAAEVIAALWCSCYPQPVLTVNGWHFAGWGDLLAHSRKVFHWWDQLVHEIVCLLCQKSFLFGYGMGLLRDVKVWCCYQEVLYFIKFCISGIILQSETSVSHPGSREITCSIQSVYTSFGS